jgi:hypothetical protein
MTKIVKASEFEEWAKNVAQWREATDAVPLLVREEIMKSKLEPDKPKAGARSLMFDPLSIQFAMGYKDRRYSLSYDVLKRIPNQLAIIAAIMPISGNIIINKKVLPQALSRLEVKAAQQPPRLSQK